MDNKTVKFVSFHSRFLNSFQKKLNFFQDLKFHCVTPLDGDHHTLSFRNLLKVYSKDESVYSKVSLAFGHYFTLTRL